MPEMEVMQSLLAAANNKPYVSRLARARLRNKELMVESPQSLTIREKEILTLMLKGATDREISDHLLISIHTVKDYGKSIRRKYQVKSRVQLISGLLSRNLQLSPSR
jgi:DNA-binding CsgD family transcriptional regulator